MYLIDVHYNQKLFGYLIKEQVKDILPFMLPSLLMAFCITWVGWQISTSLIFVMFIKIFVGAVVYFSCLLLLQNPVLKESLDLLKTAIKK
jgi:ABC-type phosphate/phosphonate transport system permease subunit